MKIIIEATPDEVADTMKRLNHNFHWFKEDKGFWEQLLCPPFPNPPIIKTKEARNEDTPQI